MSHHASGPNFEFPRGDARLDMTDLFVFTKPGDPSKSIIVLNVHPSFRLDSPESTTTEPFAPGPLYEIKIDTNGPNSALGTNAVGIWARTLDKTADGWIQADRGGRPLQAVFLSGEKKEEYLSGEPANDDRFIGVFAHELEHSGGYAPEDAKVVAKTMLPDILSYDPRRPVSFPDNGRTLFDDVADVFFSIYANRNVTDKVGPHRDLLDEFPYLGPPHSIESNSDNATSGGEHEKQG